MVLGIDFGTTRVVVSAADRGNYPLVSFDGPDGQVRDWFPALVAVRGRELRFGWEASALTAEPEWTVVRSLKRELKDAGPGTVVEIAGETFPLMQLLAEMAGTLRRDLLERSTLHLDRREKLEVMLGVPANSNSNQRFLTAEAFRAAGFPVLGLLNEPSAASIEFGHRDRAGAKGALLVYDMGGGTFDASLVEQGPDGHTVIATSGIPTLGGDDFDELLAELAIREAGHSDDLSGAETFRLLEECREKKEALNPNTRKIVIDLDRVRAGWGVVSIPASDFYDRCRPLIEETREVVERLLAEYPERAIDTLYVTGGGAELPAVARVLKETFGRRVKRSAYMRSATAIGLAIAADAGSGFRIRDRLTHHFGVWREAEHGTAVTFDVLVPGGTSLPGPGEPPYVVTRSYRPAHNVGHFRYVECSRIGDRGEPSGDLTIWGDIRFPFDPALRAAADLDDVAVSREGEYEGRGVVEEYSCDASGNIAVRIAEPAAGFEREYRLGNWTGPEQRVQPGRRKRGAAQSQRRG